MGGIMDNSNLDDSRTFRILMLHGFAGSWSDFHAKSNLISRRIRELVTPETLSEFPGGIEFCHPDAPITLEFPVGFEPQHDNDDDGQHEVTALGWWYGRDTVSQYKGLELSLAHLARYLRKDLSGPIHAIVGFSQGACLAGMVTSLLDCCGGNQKDKEEKISAIRSQGLPIDAFVSNLHPGQEPLRWFIGIGGYVGSYYDSLYRWPIESTPSCHTLASMDAVVEHYQTMELARVFTSFDIVPYHGSHFVPRDKKSVESLARFALRHSSMARQQQQQQQHSGDGGGGDTYCDGDEETATPVSSKPASLNGEVDYVSSSSAVFTSSSGASETSSSSSSSSSLLPTRPVLSRSRKTNVIVRRRRVVSRTNSLR